MVVKSKDIRNFFLGDSNTSDKVNKVPERRGHPDEGLPKEFKYNFISTLGCITFLILIFIINVLIYAIYKVWG